MSVVLLGSTSGSITLQEPAVAGTTVLDLPATSGTLLTTATPFSNGQGPAFYAFNSTATSMISGAATTIALQTEVYDTASAFNNTNATVGTAPAYSFNPQVAGYYQINASIRTNSTSSYLGCYLLKNGTNYSGGNFSSNSQSVGQSTISTIIYMNGSTDYIQLSCFIVTTVDTATGQLGTYMNGCLVRAA